MAVQYDQLHMVTYGLIVVTKCSCSEPSEKSTKSHNSPKFGESKWQLNMVNYTWWLTTLQSLNKIRWTVSEELHPQGSDVWMDT